MIHGKIGFCRVIMNKIEKGLNGKLEMGRAADMKIKCYTLSTVPCNSISDFKWNFFVFQAESFSFKGNEESVWKR